MMHANPHPPPPSTLCAVRPCAPTLQARVPRGDNFNVTTDDHEFDTDEWGKPNSAAILDELYRTRLRAVRGLDDIVKAVGQWASVGSREGRLATGAAFCALHWTARAVSLA